MEKPAPMCFHCRHYRGIDSKIGDDVCDAFPKGIPKEIFSYYYDHRLPFPNDNGIRLEPNPKHYTDEEEFNRVADLFTTKTMPDVKRIEEHKKEAIRMGISIY